MGREAIEHYLYLMDQAFEAEGHPEHALMLNLKSLRDDDWRWLPEGASRRIFDIAGHVVLPERSNCSGVRSRSRTSSPCDQLRAYCTSMSSASPKLACARALHGGRPSHSRPAAAALERRLTTAGSRPGRMHGRQRTRWRGPRAPRAGATGARGCTAPSRA